MYELKPDEKTTSVMVYTEEALYHGQIVTRDFSRVNIFLRTEGAPNYLHLLNAQMIRPGSTPRTINFDEIFIPTIKVIGFHVGPDIENELDYDPMEENRMMAHVKVVLGSFLLESKIRISTQTDLSTSLEVSRVKWLSLYEASITNLYLAQMKVQTPLLLVRQDNVSFGLIG